MKINRQILLACCLLVLLAACASQPVALNTSESPLASATLSVETQPGAVLPATPTAQVELFDREGLKNMAYHLDSVAEALPDSKGDILLKDGEWTQTFPDAASAVTVQYLDNATGDLNGDGVEDAIVLIAIDTGGTGNFINLAALVNENGQPIQKATYFLGDRVKVQSLSIQDGIIKLEMIVHGPQDPQCCPTLQAVANYRLQGSKLVEQK